MAQPVSEVIPMAEPVSEVIPMAEPVSEVIPMAQPANVGHSIQGGNDALRMQSKSNLATFNFRRFIRELVKDIPIREGMLSRNLHSIFRNRFVSNLITGAGAAAAKRLCIRTIPLDLMDDNRKLVFATYLADNIVMEVDLRVNTLTANKKTGLTMVKMALSTVPFAGLGIGVTDAVFTAIGSYFTSFWIENRPFLIYRITSVMYDFIQPLNFTDMKKRNECHNKFVDAFERFVVIGNPVFESASDFVGSDGQLRFFVENTEDKGILSLRPKRGTADPIRVEGYLIEYKDLYEDGEHIKTLNGFSNLKQPMRRYEGNLTDLSVLQVVQTVQDKKGKRQRQYYLIANMHPDDSGGASLSETTDGVDKKGGRGIFNRR